jgi:hypothetical protein
MKTRSQSRLQKLFLKPFQWMTPTAVRIRKIKIIPIPISSENQAEISIPSSSNNQKKGIINNIFLKSKNKKSPK